MDWRYAAHLQLRTIVPGSQGLRRTVESVSQADSAGSIPVTRSTFSLVSGSPVPRSGACDRALDRQLSRRYLVGLEYTKRL